MEKPRYQLSTIEEAALWGYLAYSLSPRAEYQLKSNQAKNRLQTVMLKMIAGAHGTVSLVDEAQGVFGDYPMEIYGKENIPARGGFVIASNHYNRGPMRGMWQGPIMATTISRQQRDPGDREYRIIFANTKFFLDRPVNLAEQFLSRSPLSTLSTPSINLLHSVQDQFNESARRIMGNVARAWNFILVEEGTREIFATLENDGVVILYPTAKAQTQMGRCIPDSGKLVGLLGRRYHTPILPIGAWFDPKRAVYMVNIGSPKIYVPEKGERAFPQVFADDMGKTIAQLLPVALQGYYAPSKFTYSQLT